MSSLKSFLHSIAGRLQLSPAALYERQRELVRHGLLPVREGRGPGSGVPLTPETVATFLIGLLATDSLIDLAEHTAGLCSAKPLLIDRSKGSTRRGRTFHADLAQALLDSEFTGADHETRVKLRCAGIQVTRHWRGTLLQIRELPDKSGDLADGFQGVEYVVSEDARRDASVISHTASIELEPFWMIGIRLRRELGLDKPNESQQ